MARTEVNRIGALEFASSQTLDDMPAGPIGPAFFSKYRLNNAIEFVESP